MFLNMIKYGRCLMIIATKHVDIESAFLFNYILIVFQLLPDSNIQTTEFVVLYKTSSKKKVHIKRQ